MVAISSSSSQPKATPRQWPNYYQYLYCLAQQQPHSSQLWFTTQNWRPPTVYYPTKTDPFCGGVFFLEYIQDHFRIDFKGQVSHSGSMHPESVQEFLTRRYNFRRLNGPKTRVLLHVYGLVVGPLCTGRYGLNNALLLELGHQHQMDPHMYMPHYRPTSGPSPEALPSLRKVLKFETDKLLFTACICTDPEDEDWKTLLVICGEKPAREHEEALIWRVGDQHALSRTYLEGGRLAFPWGLAQHSMQYLNALQSATFSASTTLESNLFEALLPLLRISIATEIDYVNTAIQVWYEKKGLMYAQTTYPDPTSPPTTVPNVFHADVAAHTTGPSTSPDTTPNTLFVDERKAPLLMKTSEITLQSLKQLDMRRHKALELSESVKLFFTASHPITHDVALLIKKQNMVAEFLRDSISVQASENSLEESRAAIAQTHTVARISTVGLLFTLAFLPVSLVTSVFGMNVDVLTPDGTRWWNVLYGVLVVYAVTLGVAASLYPAKARELIALRPRFARVGEMVRKAIGVRIRLERVVEKGEGKKKQKEQDDDDDKKKEQRDPTWEIPFPPPAPPLPPPLPPLRSSSSAESIPVPPSPPPLPSSSSQTV